ncbi:MAG: permease prefix domain 1-containing protein [Terriglobales bacterium]
MPDWKALVRERMGVVSQSSAEETEVIAELAGHLEDVYEELRATGMPESDAMGHALGHIGNWSELATRIRRAKDGEAIMNTRTKTLWLPGLIALTASMVWLMILQRVSFKPTLPGPWLHSGLAFAWYPLWLVPQPLFGAAGAYLSRRAGAERRTELTASVFPAIVMLGLWLVLLTYIVIERYSHVAHQWPLVFAGVFFWSILPGASLLLGRFLYVKTLNLAKS